MSYLEENLYLKKDLHFKDGKFRILCISDLHGVADFDRRLTRDLAAMLDKSKPDLVLMLGDAVWRTAAESVDSVRNFLREVVKVIEDRKIPWAHVFGNHDDEKGVTNEMQQEVYEEFEYCLTKRGPEEVSGIGNYVLPIKDSRNEKIIYNVWGLDSHDSANEFADEYSLDKDRFFFFLPDSFSLDSRADTIRFDQIMWYWNSSVELEKKAGEKIPSLMVFHIPVPEYILCYKNVAQTKYSGTRREHIGCGMLNSGLFSTLVQRGDVKTLICGHDHINDFEGTYCGIKMTYDAGLNYDCYCDDDLRGGRIVDIDESDPWNVKTYMLYAADCVEDYPGTEMRG